MARRRRDRWTLGPAFSLPEAARGGPEVDLRIPDPVLVWVQFPDRILEVEARVLTIQSARRSSSGASGRAPTALGSGEMRFVLAETG